MSMSLAEFREVAEHIARENDISIDLAEECLSIIGDTPEVREDGLVDVYDAHGNKLATLRLPREE